MTASKPNNFFLQEVIDDLMNSKLSLVSPLMKLKYFGHLTKIEELLKYTKSEINGYDARDIDIPDYRQTSARLMVDIQAFRNTHTAELPISMLDNPFRDEFRFIKVRDGISSIEKMVSETSNATNGKDQIITSLPLEILPHIQPAIRKLYKSDVRLDAVGARIIGNSNVLLEIPNAIRTRLLEFTMEIAEKFGYDISIETFNNNQKANNQTIINHMNTTINNNGDGNVINTGDNNTIENKNEIFKGNIDRLKEELEKNGIEKSDIEEITEIIKTETPDIENGKLGEKSNNWILGIIGKSLKGIGSIATKVSANLLGTLIKQYYGME